MPPLSLLFYCFLSDPYADTHENCWVKVDRVVRSRQAQNMISLEYRCKYSRESLRLRLRGY